MSTSENYLEEIKEDIQGIKSATDKLYTELQNIKYQINNLKKLTNKYKDNHGFLILDNYDIEDPDSYEWSNGIPEDEYDECIYQWNEFVRKGYHYDDMYDDSVKIDGMLRDILDIIDQYD